MGTDRALFPSTVSALAKFTFSIDGHDLTIIELDGVLHKPYTVKSFDICKCERLTPLTVQFI